MKLHGKIRNLLFALMAFAMSASAFIPGIQPLERNIPRVGINQQFSYDCANRLTSVSSVPSVVQYLYDASGALISRTTSNGQLTTTNLLVLNYSDPLKRPLAETDGSGHVTRFYIWGPSGLLAHLDVTDNGSQITVNSVRYYHADELGSTLALTDSSGHITDEFGYTPYGEQLGHLGTTETPYRWLGGLGVRMEDETQQLYCMNRRFYSASLMRFLTRDPSGLDGGPNAYLYASANPLFFVDPYGLCPTWASSVPSYNYSFEDSLRDTMAPGIAAASVFNPVNIGTSIANEYQANYNYSGSHYNAANLTFNPVVRGTLNTMQAASGTGYMYNNSGSRLSTGQRIGSGVGAAFNAFEAVGVGYVGAKTITSIASRLTPLPYWPPDRGFNLHPNKVTLQTGSMIDRYGAPSGFFASPQGTPFAARALPASHITKPLNLYEVVKPFDVDAGLSTPWFRQSGGGIQFDLGRSVQDLIDSGYLAPR